MINTDSLKKKSISNFSKIKKVVMPYNRSIDIDSIQDWNYIRFLVESKKINLK
jgi:CMP-N-acetylneuraminic acid synthetase